MVVANNKLYAAGGRDSSDSYPAFFALVESKVDVFDFTTGKWSTLPSDFPRGRAGAPAIAFKGVPWLAGGEGSGRAWTEVDVLSGGEFVAGPAMPHPRHGFGMFECNGVVWVAGGAGVQGGGRPQMQLDAYFSGQTPAPCKYQVAPPPSPSPTPSSAATKPITKPDGSGSSTSNAAPTSAPATTGDAESSSAPNGKTVLSPSPTQSVTPVPSATASSSAQVAVPSTEVLPSVSASVRTPTPSLLAAVPEPLTTVSDSPFVEPSVDGFGSGGEQLSVSPTVTIPLFDERVNSKDVAQSANTSISAVPSASVAISASASASTSSLLLTMSPTVTPSQTYIVTPTSTPSSTRGIIPTTNPTTDIDLTTTEPSTSMTPTNLPNDVSESQSTTPFPPNTENSSALGDTSDPERAESGGATASESSSPTPKEDNPAACFPAHATVRLEDGSEKAMENLQIGDRVLVAHPDTYSEVYFFSHAHADHASNFVSIRTGLDGVGLQLSARHLVYANGELVEAQHVRVGDKVLVAHDQREAAVVAVERIAAKGLYNPHTLHGDIIVNRVAASTLTRTLHPTVARMLLQPFHTAYRVAGPHPAIHAVNRGVLRMLERVVW